MFFQDTRSGGLREFIPMHGNRINIFVCGPTVQDHFHLGHARTYIFFDMMVKYLRASGYSVFYLQNITDIDDKIINRAKDENVDPMELARSYMEEYFGQMKDLGIDSVSLYARATEHIDEIISQISALIGKGVAYETDDGVYFEVRKFRPYGEISGQKLDRMKHGARGEVNENKRNPEDFAVWKKMKPGEPYWDSPWGKGRPGWHIEDTAIAETYFGPEYDIHGGGSDLIFPHHEAENAIARTISGKEFLARYWIHTGMLNINSEKMSKSLKNFRTISETLKSYSPEVLRLAMLNANFRTMLDFSDEMMNSSRENVDYITNVYRKLGRVRGKEGSFMISSKEEIVKMKSVMDNDFDTRTLITMILEMCNTINRNLDQISEEAAEDCIAVLNWADRFLGIIKPVSTSFGASVVEAILEIRRILREKKEYELSDRIRAELKSNGVYIEDANGKTEWWFGEGPEEK